MSYQAKRPLRILLLCREELVPPVSTEGMSADDIQPFKTEYDVAATLENMGHSVEFAGLYDDINYLRRRLWEVRPHLAFNLLEEFHGEPLYDQHVVSYLELLRQPYTGCNPLGLTLAHDKAMSKKILAYHRIHVPRFAVYPKNRKPPVRKKRRLSFPLLVKSVSAEGSTGISKDSVVYDDASLEARVAYIHETVGTGAIAEEYIEGREIYMGILGNRRLQTFVPWELLVEKLPAGEPMIATDKLKWDYAYQKKVGVETKAADLSPEMHDKFDKLSKKIYRILGLSGYARLDFRLRPDGKIFLLEANPNPNIAYGEDFAESAEASGIDYAPLLQRILSLGLRYDPVRE